MGVLLSCHKQRALALPTRVGVFEFSGFATFDFAQYGVEVAAAEIYFAKAERGASTINDEHRGRQILTRRVGHTSQKFGDTSCCGLVERSSSFGLVAQDPLLAPMLET